MKCGVHETDLSALLDGELGALEERRVRDHLATCRECRTEYQEVEKISAAVRDIEAAAEPARSPEFIDRVVRSAAVRPRRHVARVVRFPSPLIAAAVLLFLVGLSAAVLERSLSTEPIRSHPPVADNSAATVLAKSRDVRDAALDFTGREEILFDPIATAVLGDRGPELPDPTLLVRQPDPLTGEDLYVSLGLARAGGRWLSGDAYRRMRDHLEQEELLARATELKGAKPEVATVAAGNAVTGWVGSLTPGTPVTHDSLTLVPLLDGDGETGIELLDLTEALEGDLLTIREDRSSARLAAENLDGTRHVFIPAGTVLVGGYQDRVITRDTLLPPKTRALLPVLCCEEGRSVGIRDEFVVSPGMAPPDIRQILLASRDQDEVWERISLNLQVLGARNTTNALRAIFTMGRGPRKLGAYSRAFADALADPRTVGVLAYHHGEFLAGDVFSSHALLTVMTERLTTAYVFDSLRRDQDEGAAAMTGLGQPGEIISAVLRASYLRTPGAVGGQESEFSGGVSGSALIPVADARPLHVALFPEPPEKKSKPEEVNSGSGGEAGKPPPVNPPPGAAPPTGGAKRRLDERQAERRNGGNTPRELEPPKRRNKPSPGRDPRNEPEVDRRIKNGR